MGRLRRLPRPWLLVLLLVALAIALVAAYAGGGSSGTRSQGGHDNDIAAPLSSAPGSRTTPAGSTGAVKGAQAALTAGGQLFSGSANVLALGDAARARLVGRHVRGVNVQVSSLAGKNGFWVGGGANRMLVHVVGGGPLHVHVGELLRFHGTIARIPGGGKAGTVVRVDVPRSSLRRVPS